MQYIYIKTDDFKFVEIDIPYEDLKMCTDLLSGVKLLLDNHFNLIEQLNLIFRNGVNIKMYSEIVKFIIVVSPV